MNYSVFEVTDKTGRKIRMSGKQWSHITMKHPFMSSYEEEIKETLINPDKITDYSIDENVRYNRPIKSFGGFNCSADSKPTEKLIWFTILLQILQTPKSKKKILNGLS